eukprot:NODE_1016_length_2633_cov_0.438043.p2 type:complete len:102 gc:universal NODE_1016_length_2633_cov_0.438043:1745-1440(-)
MRKKPHHVFGAISFLGPGLLIFLDGNLDGAEYIRFLRQHVRYLYIYSRNYLVQVLDALDEMHGNDNFDVNLYVIYADDNASPHSTHAVTEALGEMRIQSIN